MLFWPDAVLAQQVGETGGTSIQLGVGQLFMVEHNGDSIGALLDLLFEELMEALRGRRCRAGRLAPVVKHALALGVGKQGQSR